MATEMQVDSTMATETQEDVKSGDASQSVQAIPFGDVPTPFRARAVAEVTLCIRCGDHPVNQRKAVHQRGLCCNRCPDHGPWCTMHEAQQCTNVANKKATTTVQQPAQSKRRVKELEENAEDAASVAPDADETGKSIEGRRRKSVEAALNRTEQAYNKMIHMEQKQREKRHRDDERELAAIEKRFKKRQNTLSSAVRCTNRAAVAQAAVAESETPETKTEVILKDALAAAFEAEAQNVSTEHSAAEEGHTEQEHTELEQDCELPAVKLSAAVTTAPENDMDLETANEVITPNVALEEVGKESASALEVQPAGASTLQAHGRRNSIKEVLQKLEDVHSSIEKGQLEQDEMQQPEEENANLDSEAEVLLSADHESLMNQVRGWLFQESEPVNQNVSADADQVKNESEQDAQDEATGGCEAALQKVKLLYDRLVEWKLNKTPQIVATSEETLQGEDKIEQCDEEMPNAENKSDERNDENLKAEDKSESSEP